MKFSHPFGKGKIRITQTYHVSGGNKAVDMVWDFVSNPLKKVYALGDGVLNSYHVTGGSYAILHLKDSNLKALYVHCHRWTVKEGSSVKRGQHIGYIAPRSVNGGYPEHLHLGLQWKQGSGYPNLMDYMDREIQYTPAGPVIEKMWFNGDSINWGLFKDLSYLNGPDYKPGNKLKFSDTMNLRNDNGDKVATVAKGAVGMLTSEGIMQDGYWRYGIRFGDISGVVADTSRNDLTNMAITNVNGSKPNPCKEYEKQITKLEWQVTELERQLNSANKKVEELEIENAKYKGDRAFLTELADNDKRLAGYVSESK